jgi:hypothetical protein
MDINWVRKLAALAARAPSADNTQPWALCWDGNELSIVFGQRDSAKNVFPADSHATLISVGALIENIQTVILANAVSAEWRSPAAPESGQPYATVLLTEASVNFVSPEGPLRRHTNRFPFRSDALPAGLLDELKNYREGSNRVSLLAEPVEKLQLGRLVRICSEARFCTRELHEWLIGSLRFTPAEVARGDGLDIASLALPPGGAHFFRFIADWKRMSQVNRLGLHRLIALAEASLPAKAPALLCIIGQNDPQNIISAGRLIERVWMELNLQGIGVHPYYVVTDQINRFSTGKVAAGFEAKISKVEEETRTLLALQPGEMLHMILRIGYPKLNPVRSERLPLGAVFQDTRASSSTSS